MSAVCILIHRLTSFLILINMSCVLFIFCLGGYIYMAIYFYVLYYNTHSLTYSIVAQTFSLFYNEIMYSENT